MSNLKITVEDCQPLWRDDDGFIAQGTGDTYKTFADTNVNDDDIDEREKRMEMVMLAFNNTYGKGVNPEGCEDMRIALGNLMQDAKEWRYYQESQLDSFEGNERQMILDNLKETKNRIEAAKAAISKATQQ